MAVARHAADAGAPLSRGPARPDRQQPDLHVGDLAGAAGDGDARAVLGVSDFRHAPGHAPASPRRLARSRHHRAAGPERDHAVLEPGEPARHRRPGRAAGQRDRPHAHHRPRPQRDLARQKAEADCPARARLLVGGDARAAAARRQPHRDVIRAQPVDRLFRRDADRLGHRHRRRRVRRRLARRRCVVPLRAEHVRSLAPRVDGRAVRGDRLRAGQAPADALLPHRADLRHDLRRLRDGADLPGLDLPELDHRAARRRARRVCTRRRHAGRALAGRRRVALSPRARDRANLARCARRAARTA